MKLIFAGKLPPPDEKEQKALNYFKRKAERARSRREDSSNPEVLERRYC